MKDFYITPFLCAFVVSVAVIAACITLMGLFMQTKVYDAFQYAPILHALILAAMFYISVHAVVNIGQYVFEKVNLMVSKHAYEMHRKNKG